MGQSVPKTIDIFFESSPTFCHKSQHSHEERALSHSHLQFPRTTLGTPGTMSPHWATKYDDDDDDDDDDERFAFLDSGFPTEPWVKSATYCKVWPDLEG